MGPTTTIRDILFDGQPRRNFGASCGALLTRHVRVVQDGHRFLHQERLQSVFFFSSLFYCKRGYDAANFLKSGFKKNHLDIGFSATNLM